MTRQEAKEKIVNLATAGGISAQIVHEAVIVANVDFDNAERMDNIAALVARIEVLDRQSNRFFEQSNTEGTRTAQMQCRALGIAASVAASYASSLLASMSKGAKND